MIAIIGILASLLTPSLAIARDKALEMKCLSNQRQLGTINLLYCDDNNGGMIPAYLGSKLGPTEFDSYDGDPIWTYLARPYISSEDVFACPASSFHKLTYYSDEDRGRLSIGINCATAIPRSCTDYPEYKNVAYRIGLVDTPCQSVLFADTVNWGGGSEGYRGYWFEGSSRQCGEKRFMDARHGGNVNLYFLDGHAAPKNQGEVNLRLGIITRWHYYWEE